MTPEEEAILRQQLAEATAAKTASELQLQVQKAESDRVLAEKEADLLRSENARLQAMSDKMAAERMQMHLSVQQSPTGRRDR